MNTALAVPSSAIVAVKGDEIAVTAETPDQMNVAHSALIAWCDRKMALLVAEETELRAAYQHAVEHKWKSSTLLRHANLAAARIVFYGKMKSALEAGYIIVPTFPVEVFALRTEKEKPARLLTTHRYGTHEQPAESLAPGIGEYKNPFPVVFQTDYTSALSAEDRAKGKTLFNFYAEDWKEMEFPLSMAKPTIMHATNRAMALKIFDDLGILPQSHRNRDPMIIARIRDPRSTKYSQRFVNFIVAWLLDTKTL